MERRTCGPSNLPWFQVTINPAYQSNELEYSLTLAGVKCLVAMETFKTQNYHAIIEQIDPEIWRRSPNTPIKSKALPTLKTVVFNTDSRIKLAIAILSPGVSSSFQRYELFNFNDCKINR